MIKYKPDRNQLKPGECLCEFCTAKCCRYLAVQIETPKTRDDYDVLRWFLLHDHASVFTEDKAWFLLIHSACRHLQSDNRCGIYETRPQICRDYTTKDCEYEDTWVYERYFETPEQVAEYAEAVLPVRSKQPFRTPRPSLLPIVSGV